MPDFKPTPEQLAMLGRHVVVTNPDLYTEWRGEAIAIALDPSIVVEPLDGGPRVTLPLEWARLEGYERERDEDATMTELKPVGAAPQDFRDGAATGAAIVAARLRTLESYGIPLTAELAQQVAAAVRQDFGGRVHLESLT